MNSLSDVVSGIKDKKFVCIKQFLQIIQISGLYFGTQKVFMKQFRTGKKILLLKQIKMQIFVKKENTLEVN